MISEPASARRLPREPGASARLFVFAFAWASPFLVLGVALFPAAVAVRVPGRPGIAAGAAVGIVYGAALVAAFLRVRVLAARFTPPLPLPGDIWNIGVVDDAPRRSSNWPVRLRRRAVRSSRPTRSLC